MISCLREPRKYLPSLIIVSSCMLASLSSAWAGGASEAKPAADWLQADYEPLKSLKTVPAAVLKALLLKMRYDQRLADVRERFNATDVIDSALPSRRFTFGGKSPQFVLICYEHGGYAPHSHIAVFAVGSETPQLVFKGGPDLRVRSIDELKELVRQGKLANEIGEEHQEW